MINAKVIVAGMNSPRVANKWLLQLERARELEIKKIERFGFKYDVRRWKIGRTGKVSGYKWN